MATPKKSTSTTPSPKKAAPRAAAKKAPAKAPARKAAAATGGDAPMARQDPNPAGSWPFPVGKRP